MRISDWSSDVCSSDLPASFLRVGSWIGGDRDGNPFVTAETLRLATGRNAAAVLGHYLNAVHALGAELSVSSALAPVPAAVEALAEASGDTAPSRRDEDRKSTRLNSSH